MTVEPDDAPTGQISALSIAKIIDEVDGTASGAAASKPDVESVSFPAPSRGPTPSAPTIAPSALEQALADRQALIQLCLYAMDRARSGGVVERIEQGLAGVGVTAVRPDGQRFDPALHEAGGAVATDDPSLDGVVAETEVVGFADHDRLLRAPVVTVYQRR